MFRFEPKTIASPVVFFTSRLSVPETLGILNSLRTKIPSEQSDSRKQIFNPKSLHSDLITLANRKCNKNTSKIAMANFGIPLLETKNLVLCD